MNTTWPVRVAVQVTVESFTVSPGEGDKELVRRAVAAAVVPGACRWVRRTGLIRVAAAPPREPRIAHAMRAWDLRGLECRRRGGPAE